MHLKLHVEGAVGALRLEERDTRHAAREQMGLYITPERGCELADDIVLVHGAAARVEELVVALDAHGQLGREVVPACSGE